ncbi:Bug family tripartite tricarboxylate transporter substrate binding protein [Ottowia pentelensis]|uniref:Bug family tripartite tricarboxylate transporter substrate binding protein n=1 Tax=Ottowia pentelensis TaxID=511108 RepID=A0ABV6PUD2_9BURK
MLNRRDLFVLGAAAGIALSPVAYAQSSFPDRPIRIVVPYASGSGTDNTARHFSQRVAMATGWTVIVDNKPGGNAFIGINDVLRSPADGYTLLYTGGSTHGVNSALFKKLPYDPLRDFVPVAPALFSPMVLLASPSLNVKTAAELVDLIRKNPGKYSAATGSPFQQLAVNLLRQQGKLDFQDVQYKGSGQSMTDLLGGHVDFTMVDGAAAMPQVHGGKLKALAVTSKRRVAAFPSTPTMAEAGLPDIQLNGWAGLFAKTGTPEPVLGKIREVFNAYFQSAEYKQFLDANAGFYEDLSPAQMMDFIRSEIARAQSTFQRAGIEPQ